tara:strand:+ start:371 stop:601 length:231 start_codon:yes stop_codon:yes gene_type:complete
MDNTFTYSLIISLVYIIIKFIETKLILKNNNKSLKDLIKESIIVYLSSFLGIYVVEQYNTNLIIKEPTAFTENPSF